MKKFSVLILTHDEEIDIIDCIASVACSDDIVVLDSFSHDKTKEFATSCNVRFYQREFDNFSDQRNFGLHQIQYKNDYVLMLDADERVTSELIQELLKLCNTNDAARFPVYLVRRKVFLDDKILKWNVTSAIWTERLVKPAEVFHVGIVHEKLNYKGKCGYLKEYLIHHQFSKGLRNWIERRKMYARLQYLNTDKAIEISSISSKVLNRRLKIKKHIVEKLPFSYAIYFLYNILIKFAFLDGRIGLKYIALETYSLYINSKYKKHVKKSLSLKVSPGSVDKKQSYRSNIFHY